MPVHLRKPRLKLKLPKPAQASLAKLSTKSLKSVRFSKVNLALFVLVFGAIGGYILLQSQAATTNTANVFVSPNGSDSGANCLRFATPTTNPDPTGTSLCATFNKAYQLASPGDSVEVEDGSYSTQYIYRDVSNGKPGTQLVTFKANGGVTVNGDVGLGGAWGGVQNSPDYLTFDGNHTTTINGHYLINYHGTVPTHDSLLNTHIQDTSASSGALVEASDGTYITISGNEIGPGCCSSDGIELHIRNANDPVPDHNTVSDNDIHDIYDTCSEFPTYLGSCSGTGYGDDGNGDHVDGIQTYSGTNLSILRNKIMLQGDHKQGIFLGGTAGSGSYSNVTIEGNMISGTSDQALSGFGYPTSGFVHIYYNTVYGDFHISDNAITAGTPVQIIGNIFNGQAGDQSAGGCTMTYIGGTQLVPFWQNNLMGYNSPCGSGDIAGKASFVQPTFPGSGTDCGFSPFSGGPADGSSACTTATGDPNLHLASGSLGLNSGEATYCPAADIDGDIRPQGATCDIGADEYDYPAGSANVFLSTTGSDTGANCKRFATPVSNPTVSTACATMTKAVSLAQPGDTIQLLPGSYGNLTVNRQTGSDSPKVVIRGDPNLVDQQTCVEDQSQFLAASVCPRGNVTITGLTVCGHGISIQNMDTSGLDTSFYVGLNSCSDVNDVEDNHDIGIVNSHFTYQSTLMGHDLLLSHTRIGPNEQICDPSHSGTDGDNLHIWPESHTTPWTTPYNITLDHNLIYDARLGNGSGGIAAHGCGWNAHTDLVQTLGYNNLTVTNNILWGAVDGIWQDGVINGTVMSGNIVFKNNFIGPSGIDGGGGTFQLGSQLNQGENDAACSSGSYVFENNTLDSSSLVLRCSGSTNNVIRNNYFSSISANLWYTCGAGAYDYNVFGSGTNVTCGAHAKTCTPAFRYTPANNSTEANFTHGWDLHLAAADICLKGAGDPNNFALTDFDDQNRVSGSVDVGADALTIGSTSSTTPGDLNSDGHVNITDLSIMLSHYGQSATLAQGDLNADGRCTITDLSILLSHYGE